MSSHSLFWFKVLFDSFINDIPVPVLGLYLIVTFKYLHLYLYLWPEYLYLYLYLWLWYLQHLCVLVYIFVSVGLVPAFRWTSAIPVLSNTLSVTHVIRWTDSGIALGGVMTPMLFSGLLFPPVCPLFLLFLRLWGFPPCPLNPAELSGVRPPSAVWRILRWK